jgi:hypothetical protein
MTQDEIIALAKRVGFPIHHPEWRKAVEEFAALVEEQATAKEREAIIQIIKTTPFSNWFQADVIEAIRARGQA